MEVALDFVRRHYHVAWALDCVWVGLLGVGFRVGLGVGFRVGLGVGLGVGAFQ